MQIMTRDELATLLKVTPRTIEEWTRYGRIPFLKAGRTIRYIPGDVLEAMGKGKQDTGDNDQ